MPGSTPWGGRAAVYSGILRYAQDDMVNWPFVLGHEVGPHGNERMSRGLLAELGGMALAVALSQKPQQTQSLFMTACGAGTTVGFLLPYSRLEESEADHIGLILMAHARLRPAAGHTILGANGETRRPPAAAGVPIYSSSDPKADGRHHQEASGGAPILQCLPFVIPFASGGPAF